MLFTSVEICEDPENVKRNPPSVVVELFDHDKGLVRQNCRTERILHFFYKRQKEKTKIIVKILTNKNEENKRDKTKE